MFEQEIARGQSMSPDLSILPDCFGNLAARKMWNWERFRPNSHRTRTLVTPANGTCCCQWECSHCSQATSKEKCSNLHARCVARPVWIRLQSPKGSSRLVFCISLIARVLFQQRHHVLAMGQVEDQGQQGLHGAAVHLLSTGEVPRGGVDDRPGRQDDLRAHDAWAQETTRAPVSGLAFVCGQFKQLETSPPTQHYPDTISQRSDRIGHVSQFYSLIQLRYLARETCHSWIVLCPSCLRFLVYMKCLFGNSLTNSSWTRRPFVFFCWQLFGADGEGSLVFRQSHGIHLFSYCNADSLRAFCTCRMLKYVKPSGEKPYVDLIVSYEGNEEDEMGPPVRYYFNS